MRRRPDLSGLLRCPHCHYGLARQGSAWRCAAGHSFDIARQGYVNLTVGRPVHTGDTAEMLEARAAVLGAGHLDVATDAVIAACRGQLPPGALVEVGAGTAQHLARVRRALGQRPAVALDVSVPAARRAARADPPWITAVVADAWQPWPLLDGVAAAVLTICAPRNMREAARVLAPDGRLVTVTPCPDHLAEIAGPLGLLRVEADKDDRLRADAGEHLAIVDTREVRTVRVLDRDTAHAMARMGPAAHHGTPEQLAARAAGLPAQVSVTVALRVHRFRPSSHTKHT